MSHELHHAHAYVRAKEEACLPVACKPRISSTARSCILTVRFIRLSMGCCSCLRCCLLREH